MLFFFFEKQKDCAKLTYDPPCQFCEDNGDGGAGVIYDVLGCGKQKKRKKLFFF